MSTPGPAATEDSVAGFRLEGAPARGRYVRLGRATIDPILRRHAYPRPVALLLGEALALAALVGSLLKVEGRLLVQAEGGGPAQLLAAEHRSDGSLRGYVRLGPDAANTLKGRHAMAPADLLGAGALALTLEREGGGPAHQGVVALEGESLAACAEAYFLRSEQIPTRIALAVAEEYGAGAPVWRGGGALLQQIAGDDARGDTRADWEKAEALFATLAADELADPALPIDRALYRLFHEDGVRMGDPQPLADRCSCTAERLAGVLSRFSASDLADLTEPDGAIHARCQFCARTYQIDPGGI